MNTTGHQFALDLVGGYSRFPSRGHQRRRRRGLDRCESPIERQLALALSQVGSFRMREGNDHPWRIGSWEALAIVLLAQPLYGPYRADFALVPMNWHTPRALPIIIEVDGHDFHERTKEQAARDRIRDRFMASQGSIVLRFSGSEVWRDSSKCAREILSYGSRIQLSA